MLRITRAFASSLALFVVAAAAAPVSANAWPLGRVFHFHSGAGQSQDSRIYVNLFNKGSISQDVQVGEQVYSVPAQAGLYIKAPAGTSVYALSEGMGHRKGERLFEVSPATKGRIIYFN